MWQDWVLAVLLWMFVIVLIPTILHPTNKPTLSTSLLTAAGNFTLALVYATLSLWNGALGGLAISIAWFILAIQRYRLDRKERRH
ncbi:hypothetical protein HYW60_00680 [Candidatus Kaiserbacteria bacterium]|nr:hypothetical protein [Candidatus Kaiserbacteria bacterium]